MTSQELYNKFIEYKKENKKVTYRFLADKLNTSSGNVHDKFKRLKNGKSVNSNFLIEIEKIIGKSIFFGK